MASRTLTLQAKLNITGNSNQLAFA